MGQWLARLLGVQEGGLSTGEWSLELAGSALLLGVLAVFLLLGVVWIYRRESTAPGPGVRALLIGLRIFSVLLVLVLLFEPTLAVEKLEDRRPTVLFLVDDSLSMSIVANEYASADKRLAVLRILADRPALTRAEMDADASLVAALKTSTRYDLAKRILSAKSLGWIGTLQKTHRLRFFTASSKMTPIGEIDLGKETPLNLPATCEGRTSRLGDSLREALQLVRGQYVAGVVLLTDGQSNAGEDPVAVARFAGHRRPDPIPFFPVGIGSDEAQRDVEVDSLSVPSDVLKSSDPFEIEAVIQSKGCQGKTVRVALLKGDQPAGEEKTLDLTDALGGQKVVFQQIPAEIGAHSYTVRIQDLPEGDLIADNNSMSATVRVTDEKFKILFVDTFPRWEWRKLEALLDRSHNIYEYSALLLAADAKWNQPHYPDPKMQLKGFPDKYSDLQKYDLIVWGDVDPTHKFLRSGWDEDVRKFVVEGGGAFVMIAGPSYAPQAYQDTKIAEVLPILEYGVERSMTDTAPFPVALNPLLPDHKLVQLNLDPERNAHSWDRLHLYRYYDAGEIKPTAHVLLQHATKTTAKGKPCPMIMLMKAGRGQILFIGMDETWRWAKGVPDGNVDNPYNLFWNQAIKYLAANKMFNTGKGLLLKLDKDEYNLGQQAVAVVDVLDSALEGFGTGTREIPLMVQPPEGNPFQLVLKREAGSDSFVGTFVVDRKGSYRVQVAGRSGGAILAQTSFDVKEFTAEFASPQMNRQVLTQAAQASGGEFIELEKLAGFPTLLSSKTKQASRRVSNRLMDAPLVFLLFCASIVTEWIVRKRSRMM